MTYMFSSIGVLTSQRNDARILPFLGKKGLGAET